MPRKKAEFIGLDTIPAKIAAEHAVKLPPPTKSLDDIGKDLDTVILLLKELLKSARETNRLLVAQADKIDATTRAVIVGLSLPGHNDYFVSKMEPYRPCTCGLTTATGPCPVHGAVFTNSSTTP